MAEDNKGKAHSHTASRPIKQAPPDVQRIDESTATNSVTHKNGGHAVTNTHPPPPLPKGGRGNGKQ